MKNIMKIAPNRNPAAKNAFLLPKLFVVETTIYF